jgi:ribosomal protein S6--L-glutamate ligase
VVRIAIIADWLNPVVARTVQLLTERDVQVDVIYPEKAIVALVNVRVDHDLYLIKSGTDLALSVAGALHVLGAVTLNPYTTVALMRNKIIVTRMLQQAGIPAPETYATTRPADLLPLLDDGPLIIKPFRGSRGQGIQIVRHAEELARVPTDAPILAQRYYLPDAPDHKIFCIGEQIFGVRRVWPLRSYEDKLGEPFTPGPELRDIALRCGRAFGIDLFGMDIILSRGQPYVVDVNKFGSYMGVPNGPNLLANYVQRAARLAIRGEIPAATTYSDSPTD